MALSAALYSGAWFSDDALRLWRMGLNWARFGSPDFNPGHRALGFAQPLWQALLAVAFAAGVPPYVAAIAYQAIFFAASVVVLWECNRQSGSSGVRSLAKVALLGILLSASNAFREFLCAGLEFPLCLLAVSSLALVVVQFERGSLGADRAVALAALAESVLVLTQVELALVLAPLALVPAWRSRARIGRLWPLAAAGWLPIAAWVACAAAHYGSFHALAGPLAAKFAGNAHERFGQGALYILAGIIQQPLTFLFLAAAAALAAYDTWRARRIGPSALLLFGLLLELLLVVAEGGDSVAGRMLCPAVILAAAAAACASAPPVAGSLVVAGLALLFFDPAKVSLLRGAASRVPRTRELLRERGIRDEFEAQKERGAVALRRLRAVRLRDWKGGEPRRVISDSPGWDGVAAGPAATVLDSSSLGPAYPRLAGIVSTTIRLGQAPPRALEAILAFGRPSDGTLLMAERVPGSRIRFQVWTPGNVPLFSRAVRIDYGAPHRLVVAYGAKVAGGPPTGEFKVMLDGALLKDISRPMRRYGPTEVVSGWNVQGFPGCADASKGEVGRLEPAPEREFENATIPSSVPRGVLVRVRLRFSEVTNSSEPIVVTGGEGQADIVFVRRIRPGQIVFGREHWGREPDLGPRFAIDDASDHTLVIALGPLVAPADGIIGPERIRITLDGKAAYNSAQPPYPFGPDDVSVLDNPYAGSSCGRDFLGEVREVAMVPVAPLLEKVRAAVEGASGPVTLTLRLDGVARGEGLGLLENGVRGAGDIVYLVARDSTHARFFFDHWGFGGVSGPEVEFDPAAVHTLRIEMGSLAASGDAAALTRDRLTLDGRVVAEATIPSSAKGGPITIGDNSLHSSNVAAPYDGEILAVERGERRVNLSK
jgi:hypothetical protein